MARCAHFALLAALAVSTLLVGCRGYNNPTATKPQAVAPEPIVHASGGITPSSDTSNDTTGNTLNGTIDTSSQDTTDDTTTIQEETCTE